MLVLSRKPGERILIGPNIEVMVVGVNGRSVRLGFDCPQHVRVLREELRWHPAAKECDETTIVDESQFCAAFI